MALTLHFFSAITLNLIAAFVAGSPSPYPLPTLPTSQSTCGTYAHLPCSFVPAPPGMTPKCATPGTTFCESNPDYPAYLIKHLVESLGYQRVLANEEQIDFNANKLLEEEEHHHHHYHHFYASVQAPVEYSKVTGSKPGVAVQQGYNYNAPKPMQLQNSIKPYEPMPVPQPIYIPKPQHSFHYNSFVKAPKLPGHSSPGGYFYPPPVTPYSPADWLKRFARDLSDRHRREARFASLRRVDENLSPFDTESTPFRPPSFGMLNETSYRQRQERQAVLRESLCSVRERYISPQTALNTKGNWMFVVNQENTRQLVKTEICESAECSNLCNFPISYRSRCEQRYVQKRLVTLDPGGRTLYVDTYWFPSCCVCALYSGN
ncbi:protein spaetzle 5-like [Anopheles bellator]|uniref:protein spaetzle 5-like n=1 Tax=Anopheles bellator TaxID=139047 RepID=UPI00264903DC|nr:protein spaetzle 5-like [Anopheles bellator]